MCLHGLPPAVPASVDGRPVMTLETYLAQPAGVVPGASLLFFKHVASSLLKVSFSSLFPGLDSQHKCAVLLQAVLCVLMLCCAVLSCVSKVFTTARIARMC